jgi:hypothetical protein
MGCSPRYFLCMGRMGLTAMNLDISDDSVTIGLFRAIGIMRVSQDLTHLFHQLGLYNHA